METVKDPANKSPEPDMSDSQATVHDDVSQSSEQYGSERIGLESAPEVKEQLEEQKMEYTEADKESHVASDEGQGQIEEGDSGLDKKCETGSVEEQEEEKSKPDTNTADADVPTEKMDVAVAEEKKKKIFLLLP